MKTFLAICVDDEPDLLDFVAETVEGLGAEVVRAAHGQDALVALQRLQSTGQVCDLVITDINMGVMDGLTLLSKIRDSGSSVPVIILSAFGDMSKVTRALRLGAFDFIEKPFDLPYFEKVVSSALELGRSINQITLHSEPAQLADQKQNGIKIQMATLKSQTKVNKAS